MSNSPCPSLPTPSPFPALPSNIVSTGSTINLSLVELKCDLVNNNSNNIVKNNSSNVIQHQPLTFNTSGECIWATQYPEIQKACYLRRVCQFASPKELRVQNITSILQMGPTCGLTALSMIFEGSPSAATLLEMAIDKGYSNKGEMFSAIQLNELLSIGLADNRHLVEFREVTNTLVGGNLDDPDIKMQLRLGSIFLVPYDPDRNHTPCLDKGHKAHWALIVGYLIDQFDDYYVFARHGKTKNLALWSLRDLALSNANLVEFCQPAGHPEQVFILPDGGIGGRNGLRCKFIMIEHFKAKEEVVL
ncbi:actin maturation protease isoform X1 [Malaya genurostris]|uniref:actin maturation protease isoform X1 n=2 Tax=Malaya genurostris TaxID=325434 RepID=UPI0026F3B0DC|nr:actin maturation protease isoform X1 [Malaya genurostris]